MDTLLQSSSSSSLLPQFSTPTTSFPPFTTVTLTTRNHARPTTVTKLFVAKQTLKMSEDTPLTDVEVEVDGYGGGDEFPDADLFSSGRGDDDKGYDRDPELAEIMGSCLVDPEKAQSRMEERLRRKRNKILHPKTGSSTPMKTIRSWHIIGRLGGCNSMNMQLSQSTSDKRPTYDYIQGANVTPTTFYNIGDFEMQDNLGRIWVDIGTSEPLLLDVLINGLTQISSDYVGIKQLVFGGSEFENWKENLNSEDAGCSVHKI
ncbi:unnamed protein product [Linum tenue]|uniref:Uncharacterized protein n=1 Tax=Linum tenue TaxID=586396 RepID=A0AAV0S8L7_9ROSI|nr:unnamed protein product [Linum tenue]